MLGMSLELPTRPESLSDVVYETIRDAIVNRTIAPGARVTETGLAKQLNVSKTPVREALLKLREIGLIEPHGARGGRVALPSPIAIRNAYEARLALETFAAQTAARRGSAEEKAQIEAIALTCLERAQAGDLDGFKAHDSEFHEAVVRATDNPRLVSMVADTVALVTALRRRDVPRAQISIECAEAHVGIAAAITAGDDDAAAARMAEHLRHVEACVLASMLDEGAEDLAAH
jgi:GntR family transcriptional regulator, rspAB operon transcriptional repressor